jgi:hypothetical protein
MKRLIFIIFIALGSHSFAQTLSVTNHTNCVLEVKAYCDGGNCSWNCPSDVVKVNPNQTKVLTAQCTWTSAHKWNIIKYWKYGSPNTTGGTSQRISGCGPSNLDWNCGAGGGFIYGLWNDNPWEVDLWD